MENTPGGGPPTPRYVHKETRLFRPQPNVRLVVAEVGAALGGITPGLATVILGYNFLSNPFTIGTGVIVAAGSIALAAKELFYSPKVEERYIEVTGDESFESVQKAAMRHGGTPINAKHLKRK